MARRHSNPITVLIFYKPSLFRFYYIVYVNSCGPIQEYFKVHSRYHNRGLARLETSVNSLHTIPYVYR